MDDAMLDNMPLHSEPKSLPLTNSEDSQDSVPILRCYTDGPHEFVLLDELAHILKGTAYNPDPNRKWFTVDGSFARDELEKAGKLVNYLFLPLPNCLNIGFTTPIDNVCMLGVHALYRIVTYLTLKLKVFQNLTNKKKEKILEFFKVIEEALSIGTKTRFLFPVELCSELEAMADQMFSKYIPEPDPTTCNIIEHLIHLGLLYNVDMRKFKADIRNPERRKHYVREFAIACVLGRFKNLAAFIHCQKACHTFSVCTVCTELKMQSEGPESINAEQAMVRYLQSLSNGTEYDAEVFSISIEDRIEQIENSKKTERNKKKKEKAKARAKAFKEAAALTTLVVPAEVPKDPKEVQECSEARPVATTPFLKQLESNACSKCFRTSNRFREELGKHNATKNSVKKLNEKLSKTDKIILGKDEELSKTREELSERAKEIEKIQEENRILKEQIEEMKRYQNTLELKKKLADFQDKLHLLRSEDPLGECNRQVDKLVSITRNENVKNHARYELVVAKEKYKLYEEALETNIRRIQNYFNNPPELIPLPEYPELPEVFFRELEKAEKAKEEELKEICSICRCDFDERRHNELFQCPRCNKEYHLPCIARWLEEKDNCPLCRADY